MRKTMIILAVAAALSVLATTTALADGKPIVPVIGAMGQTWLVR